MAKNTMKDRQLFFVEHAIACLYEAMNDKSSKKHKAMVMNAIMVVDELLEDEWE